MKKLYRIICGKYRTFEEHKISHLLEKTLFFLFFAVSATMKMKNYSKKNNNQIRYLKFLV